MWQMIGFYLGLDRRRRTRPGTGTWRAETGRAGAAERPARLCTNIDIKRVMRSKLVLGIADGWLSMDGEIIYRAKDLKVGLFKQETPLQPEHEIRAPAT